MSAVTSVETRGLLAAYDYLDSAVDAIEGLKKAGFKEITAYVPIPSTTSRPPSDTGRARCGCSRWWVGSPGPPPGSR